MKYLFMLTILVSFSCTDLELRRGSAGETCTGADDDCRSGLICKSSVCSLANSEAITCDQVCQRFAACDTRGSGCESDCRITVEKWAAGPRQAFSLCLQSSLSCEELSSGKGPQICYDNLAIEDVQKQRCDDEWRRCDLGNTFREACYRLAKVATDDAFSGFEQCVKRANENLTCDTHQSCIDSSAVF